MWVVEEERRDRSELHEPLEETWNRSTATTQPPNELESTNRGSQMH